MILVGGDDIEQEPQLESTERHHSIIDWLSRESSGVVRSIQYHPQIFSNHHQQHHNITIDTHNDTGDDDIEQGPRRQSTERHHSIIDWLSRESSGVVRQSNTIHRYSPIITNNTKHNITIDTHNDTGDDDIEQVALHQSTERHHSIIDWLSRESSLLVRQSNTIHKYSPIITNNTKHNITIDTHIGTCWW